MDESVSTVQIARPVFTVVFPDLTAKLPVFTRQQVAIIVKHCLQRWQINHITQSMRFVVSHGIVHPGRGLLLQSPKRRVKLRKFSYGGESFMTGCSDQLVTTGCVTVIVEQQHEIIAVTTQIRVIAFWHLHRTPICHALVELQLTIIKAQASGKFSVLVLCGALNHQRSRENLIRLVFETQPCDFP